MTDNQTVASLRSEYRNLVIDWEAAKANAEKANRIFGRLHDCYKRLRDFEAGREAIAGLLNDSVTAVRLVAATHSLAWQPDKAQLVLEEIEKQPTGLYAVDAKWTLRAFRQGKLYLDW